MASNVSREAYADGNPAPVLAWYRAREARWVRRADAVVTVNDPLADHCARLWPFRARPTVLLNCQPRWDPPAERPDHLRRAAGLPPGRQVVLFLGRLGRDRGLEVAAEAVVRLRDAALVLLGFALHDAWARDLEARGREPRSLPEKPFPQGLRLGRPLPDAPTAPKLLRPGASRCMPSASASPRLPCMPVDWPPHAPSAPMSPAPPFRPSARDIASGAAPVPGVAPARRG